MREREALAGTTVADVIARADAFASRLTEPLATVGALAILTAACVTVADVLMRWLANSGVVALNEIISLFFAVAIAACIPAGLSRRVNLKVDLLKGALPGKFAAWLEAFGAFLLAVFYGLLAWRIETHAASLAAQGRTTVILGAPLAPFMYAVAALIALGAIVQAIVTVSETWKAMSGPETWSGGSRYAVGVVVVLLVALGAVVLYGVLDFHGLAGWVRANANLAVALSFILMWGCLLGLMPLAAVVGLIGLAGIATEIGWNPAFSAFSSEAVGFLTNSQVATLPLFLMMGSFAAVAGVSEDLYRLAQALFGGLKGGLAYATIGGCAGFGAVTGSSIATAATFGQVALPQMEKRGYSVALATGSVAAGGTLGALVPPSSPLVLYALLTESSIGQLFIAAMIPALVAIILYFGVIALQVRVFKNVAPDAQTSSLREVGDAVMRSGAVLLLFGVVIGGLYGGVFTATESAAVGAVGAFLMAWFRGRLNPKVFLQVMAETTGTTALIYGLIFGALTFSFFVAVSGVPELATAAIKGLALPPAMIVGLLLLVFLALGCVMDSFAVMIITVPIVTPVITGMGYDLLWWGIINLAVIETGMITPPFGLNVFVLKSLLPKTPISVVFRGVLPFVVADVVKLALFVIFPLIVLALPYSMR